MRISKNGVPKNPEIHKIKKKVPRKNRKIVESLLQQVKQGPYYICTVYHQTLYQYHIRNAELYHPVKPFGEKLYTAVHIPSKSASWVLDTGRLIYTVNTWKIPYYTSKVPYHFKYLSR